MALRQKAGRTLPTILETLKTQLTKPNHPHQLSHPSPSPSPSPSPLPSLRRTFSLYDQINLIDNVPQDQLRFQEFDEFGFKVNGVKYEGSLLCIGNLLLSWTPKKFSDITPESLSIFKILRPVPGFEQMLRIWIISAVPYGFNIQDSCRTICSVLPSHQSSSFQFSRLRSCQQEIFILGCGRHIEPVNSEIWNFIRSTGMKLEVVDSRNAASTYNILNEEGRIVAAGLLPYGASS